jgi:hypothetical protein
MISDTNGSHPDEVLAQHVAKFDELVKPLSLFERKECQESRDSTDIGMTMKAIW